jgi:anti-sigma factor RsiW
VGALAATVLLAAWVWWGRSGSGDVSVPAQAARDFVAVAENGSLALERRTDRAADLEAFFAEAPNAPRVRVIDLGMMGFTLEGGRRHVIGGVPSALYVYRGTDGQRLACQMFEGRLEDLPPTADLRENNGFMFRVYRDGDVSMVFWQEGDLVCVLVSRLPVEEVVALAFAKAMRPA